MTVEVLSAAAVGHTVVGHAEWRQARQDLLAREKELRRQMDDIAKERRNLPWERVEQEYVFDTNGGRPKPGRLIQQQKPVADLSLHAWTGMAGGLQELLIRFRSLRSDAGALGAAGR